LSRFNSTKLKVMPLKGTNSVDELYQRSDEVEAQINEVLKLDSATLLERANISDYKAPGFLQEECLVALIRAALSCHDDSLADSLFEILFRRCAGSIYSHLKFDDIDRRDDAYNEVVCKLVEHIIDLNSTKADFLQVRFGLVVKRLTITAFNKYLPNQIEKNSEALDVEAVERAGYITNCLNRREIFSLKVFGSRDTAGFKVVCLDNLSWNGFQIRIIPDCSKSPFPCYDLVASPFEPHHDGFN